jgi:acyl carrier protein
MKSRELIKKFVFETIEQTLYIEEKEFNLTEETNIKNDLGADSLDMISLIMVIEEKYDLYISDEDIKNIQTVNDVINFVFTRVNS